MKNKGIVLTLLVVITLFTSCIYDPGNDDITIINSTPDSLYYYIHGYKAERDYKYNIAYDSTAANERSIHQYNIAYNINMYKILPNDTLHPSINETSWKKWASRQGGLTILFYKRNIQKLPVNVFLTDHDIFCRIDLTTKQLDSLKYKIELKK